MKHGIGHVRSYTALTCAVLLSACSTTKELVVLLPGEDGQAGAVATRLILSWYCTHSAVPHMSKPCKSERVLYHVSSCCASASLGLCVPYKRCFILRPARGNVCLVPPGWSCGFAPA